jgi:hypothetical protein
MRIFVAFSGMRRQIVNIGVYAEANQQDCPDGAENHQDY